MTSKFGLNLSKNFQLSVIFYFTTVTRENTFDFGPLMVVNCLTNKISFDLKFRISFLALERNEIKAALLFGSFLFVKNVVNLINNNSNYFL